MPTRSRRRRRAVEIPLIPRRHGVIFPNTAAPFFVGRRSSVRAVDDATAEGLSVAVALQRDPALDEITLDDLFPIATEAVITRALRLPDGTTQVWAQAQRRLLLEEIVADAPYYRVRATPIEDVIVEGEDVEALKRATLGLFQKVVQLSTQLPDDAYVVAMNIEEAGALADFVAASLQFSDQEGIEVLEAIDPVERLRQISLILARELDVLELQSKIHDQVQEEVDKSQREYFLREQLRVIQKELGESDPHTRDIEELRQKLETAEMPPEAARRAEEELRRLEAMPPISPEVPIVRTYIDWLVRLPWTEQTDDDLDLKRAAQVLDRNHYGLPRVKERILEFMAVRQLANSVNDGKSRRSPILCFVGPPGVGKTSLGKSISEALGRKFVRMSLGGIRDEAEIRGHRRTYVGALPGRILHAMRQAGTINPVFMLDEIDKVGVDFRGDPSSALLEVLDPEQNVAFADHYLDVPYDLSKVLFIATANMLDPVLPALRDRLEVIELPGYTEDEKLHIAQLFLVPRQLDENGITPDQLHISEGALRRMIREYTREAGVRNLEREIAAVCRKTARQIAEGNSRGVTVNAAALGKYLGAPKFFWGVAETEDQVGVATGVAWTEMGGDILGVEVTLMPGKGQLILTGQLGEVMRESAQAALSYARSRSVELGLTPETFEKTDIHVHVPAGAVPKEGPSAGITIATALVSALTRRPVNREVAMTGEITLRGRVLPVGGLKEKVLAAHRAGIRKFVLPKKNEKDLDEVPAGVRRDLQFVLAEDMSEVLHLALTEAPAAALKAI